MRVNSTANVHVTSASYDSMLALENLNVSRDTPKLVTVSRDTSHFLQSPRVHHVGSWCRG